MFKNLYQYRELLKSNVKKEIRGKYKGSFLGILWSFVNPLLQVLVYAIVFPIILKSPEPNYVVFLIIGILPWTWFTTSLSQGTFTILGNAGIIKKVYFPREILPISVVTSGLINYLISCLIIFAFLMFSGIGFSGYLIYLPLVILVQYVITLGIVFITSAINVYIRDAEYIINFIVNMLFYATPILYSPDVFGGTKFSALLQFNPLATIINSYRAILYHQTAPDMNMLLLVLGVGFAILLIGIQVFRKLERGFAEEV